VFIFVENDPERFASLESEIQRFWTSHPGGCPKNVKVYPHHGTFQEVAESLVAQYSGDSKRKPAPTLAFVDPFGWSGVPLTLIRDLLSFDKCEVIFNFMYDSVNRFVADTREGVARHFAGLFGTETGEHLAATNLSGDERKIFLHDLYVKQLRDVGGFRYVRSFELQDVGRGRTAYYLMFGTRHHLGLKVMKEAMWALDPVAGARFEGFAGGQRMLFAPEPDLRPLRDAILQEFSGQTVPVENVELFVIEETDYKTTQYKKGVLKPLEVEGLLTSPSARARRLTYPARTILQFGSEDG
jgi:three-Cys-motif partner protein